MPFLATADQVWRIHSYFTCFRTALNLFFPDFSLRSLGEGSYFCGDLCLTQVSSHFSVLLQPWRTGLHNLLALKPAPLPRVSLEQRSRKAVMHQSSILTVVPTTVLLSTRPTAQRKGQPPQTNLFALEPCPCPRLTSGKLRSVVTGWLLTEIFEVNEMQFMNFTVHSSFPLSFSLYLSLSIFLFHCLSLSYLT